MSDIGANVCNFNELGTVQEISSTVFTVQYEKGFVFGFFYWLLK